MPAGLGTLDSPVIAVVNAASIADGARLVEHERHGCPVGGKTVGNLRPRILEHHERQAKSLGVARDGVRVVLRIAIDADKEDALRGVFLVQRRQRRQV